MGRLSSSERSLLINEAELIAPVVVSAVLANDVSKIESASMGLVKTKSWSADRTLGRDAETGRGEWRPVPGRGACMETRPGSGWGVTDRGEGVSPNIWVNFRDFLTSSARSCGCR